MFKQTHALIDRVTANARALAGRPGVVAARALAERVTDAAHQHARNLRPWGGARSADRPARVRAEIERLSTQQWVRGEYGELGGVRVPPQWRNHPALRDLAAPLAMLERATAAGLLPTEFSQFDRKGRGEQVAVDLYGYGHNLLLVQVRTSERRYAAGYLRVVKEYRLTDGTTVIEVPPARIKRAATQDPAIDAPIRALKPVLPPEWAARIDAPAMKLAAPQGTVPIAFKVVEQRPDGALVSVFDGSDWALNVERKERARRDHGGGLYAYATAEQAIAAARRGEIFNRRWHDGKTLVLVRCETGSGGRFIRYPDHKLAFHALTPVEVIGPVSHA